MTTFNEDEYIFEGLKNGADGYLLKDISSEELVKAIKTVYQGNTLLQPDIAKKMINAIKITYPTFFDNVLGVDSCKYSLEI